MVSHQSLSDSKSPQVCGTLLSIIDNLDNGAVWMVFSYFQVLQSLYQSIGDCAECTNDNWYHWHCFFSSLAGSRYLSFFRFLSVLPWGHQELQNALLGRFSFFLLLSITRPSYLIIIINSLELFTSVLADGLSLEIEWQQVSSSLQDSSQYSGRLQ